MTSSKISFRFDYTHPTSPERHVHIESSGSLSSIDCFNLFRDFLLALGHTDYSIGIGACSIAFHKSKSKEDMKKITDNFNLYLQEEHLEEIRNLKHKIEKMEQAILDLRAKLSRSLNPDNEQYTDEELDAMYEHAKRIEKEFCE